MNPRVFPHIVKSIKTYLILVFVLTTMGGVALAWRQYQELVELRAAAMNKDERADLQKRIWDLEKLNRQISDQLVALQAHPGDGDPADALAADDGRRRRENGAPEIGRSGRGNAGAQQVALRELMAKPEVQAIINQQRKVAIEQRYAALFHSLNLSPEQSEKLKGLLADRQTTLQDVMAAAREQGINPRSDPESFRKLVADAQNQVTEGIKAVIGDTGLTQLQNYEQTLPQRNLVNDLQQRLSYTNTPLSPAQAEQLVQILASNTPSRAGGGNGMGRGPAAMEGFGPGFGGRGGEIGALAGAFIGGPGGGAIAAAFEGGRGGGVASITPAAVNQAQAVLAQPQVAALQQMQQQQQAQQQLQQMVRSTLQQNAPGSQKNGGTTAPANGGNGRRRGGG